MSYNSKNIRTVAGTFWCTSRANLSESALERFREGSKLGIWGSYEQKENTYIKGGLFQIPPLK